MKGGEAGGTKLVAVELTGSAGRIEAMLNESEAGAHSLAALVCHPHPLYGGTMHNKVVHRLATTFHDMGAAVLRFNFRGAGESEGRHDHGRGEADDARVALAFLRARHPRARVWLAGFSFGSWIATMLARTESGVEHLILVAPPVRRSDFAALETLGIPKLIVQGTADTVCPIEELEAQYPRWADPKRMIRVEGATHFFDKRLKALNEVLVEALAGAAGGGTSSVT